MTAPDLCARLQSANPDWAVTSDGANKSYVTVDDGGIRVALTVYRGFVEIAYVERYMHVPNSAARVHAILSAALGLEAAARVPVRTGAWSESERAAFDAVMSAPISERHRAITEEQRP